MRLHCGLSLLFQEDSDGGHERSRRVTPYPQLLDGRLRLPDKIKM